MEGDDNPHDHQQENILLLGTSPQQRCLTQHGEASRSALSHSHDVGGHTDIRTRVLLLCWSHDQLPTQHLEQADYRLHLNMTDRRHSTLCLFFPTLQTCKPFMATFTLK